MIVLTDRCIDQYVQLRNDTTEEGKAKPVDERLSAIVERLFERYCESETEEPLQSLLKSV